MSLNPGQLSRLAAVLTAHVRYKVDAVATGLGSRQMCEDLWALADSETRKAAKALGVSYDCDKFPGHDAFYTAPMD